MVLNAWLDPVVCYAGVADFAALWPILGRVSESTYVVLEQGPRIKSFQTSCKMRSHAGGP